MISNSFSEIKQKLKDALSHRVKVHIKDIKRKPSAVLLPIYSQEDQPYILFTRRTQLVHHHKGEISFPGGGYSEGDGSLLNTALRESFEEIGIAPQAVEILGELDDIITRGSPYIITPFVGVIFTNDKFILNNFEIAEIIETPIAALLEAGCCRLEPSVVAAGDPYHPHVYYYQDKRITGATAAILRQFLEIYQRAVK